MAKLLITYNKFFFGNYLHDFYAQKRLIDLLIRDHTIISYPNYVLYRQNFFFIILKICEKIFGIHSNISLYFHKKFKIIPKSYFKNITFDIALGWGFGVEKNNKYISIIFSSFKHNYNLNSSKLNNLILFKKYYLNKVDKIIVVTKNSKQIIAKFCNIEKSKIYIIPPLLNIDKTNFVRGNFIYDKIKDINNNQFNILFIGRDGLRKGADKIDELSLKKFPNNISINFICVSNYQFKSDKINSYRKVNQQKLIDLYLQSNIFIFPTTFDTFGNVIPEAMYFGNAIITKDDFPQNEIINFGECGLLTKTNNVDEIYEKVCTYINNKDLLKDHIKSSIKIFNKEYSKNVIKDKYLKLIKENSL